jgi:hypothetical protein
MVPADFKVGDRVQFTNLLLRGRTGTISRSARVLWKPAWMVELDGGSWAMRRTRATEKVLRHVT